MPLKPYGTMIAPFWREMPEWKLSFSLEKDNVLVKWITKIQKKIVKSFFFMRNVYFHFDAEQCRPVLRQWCLNPNRHEGGHFYLLYISIFSLILMCLPRGVMDKAANSGSVDPWFDPCLMLSFFHFHFFLSTYIFWMINHIFIIF